MTKDDKAIVEEVDGVERIRKEARPDFSTPPPRKQLPIAIQTVLDDEEKMWETISDGRYVLHLNRPKAAVLTRPR